MSVPKLPPVDQPLGAPGDPWETTVLRDIAVGRTVGEYVIRRRIGAGGMGIVYEAEHPQIGRRVAIKVLRPDIGATRDLLDEARAASAVRHRHIIDVFGFGELQGLGQYLVMDFLEGVPLDEEIRIKAPMTAEQVVSILDDTAAALGAAHAKGIVHRDLKPGNLFLVQESGGTRYVKVLDFGLAKAAAGMADGRERKTREGTTLGTPEYMAPEQAQGKPVDGRTDLYALGVIAFEMLTGRLPFNGDSPFQIAVSQVNDAPPPVRSVEPSVPVPLEALVMKLLSKNPAERPQTAELVRAELKRIQRALAQEITKSGDPSPGPAPAKTMTDEPPTPLEVAPVEAQTTPVPVAPGRSRAVLLAAGAVAVAGVVVAIAWPRQAVEPAAPLVVAPPPVQQARAPKPVPAPEPEPVTDPEPQPAPVAPRPQKAVVKQAPKAPQPGALQVVARGCQGRLLIDGKAAGSTPLSKPISLPAGKYEVKLVNDNCGEPVVMPVTIRSGDTASITLTMKPK